MKKHGVYIICALILLLIVPSVLIIKELTLPSVYSESYYAELSPMTKRLYETRTRKLIIIGGSSVAFGIDGDLLEGLLSEGGVDVTVCPYGLYAAVGTSAMLSLSEDSINEGDIIVFAFEPTEEALTDYFGATAFLKCAEDDFSLFTRLNGEQRKAAIGNYIPFLQERAETVRSGDYPKAQGAYRRDSFNESCTMTYFREGNTMTLGYDTTEPISLAELTPSDAFTEAVNGYIESAKKKGAECFLSFCPINAAAVTDSSEEALTAYFDSFNGLFSCRTISDPHSYIMDAGWFYDSNFHLNSAGAKIRTVRLAEDILAEYGFYREFDIELPDMPESAAKPIETDGDAYAFIFEPTADGLACVVAGLTDEGKTKETLTVPSSYNSLPVAGLLPAALDGADSLIELRLPETVESFLDLQFAYCPSLKRVIITRTASPTDLTDNALNGADGVTFFVPKDVYWMYKDGYGCETNPWERYLDKLSVY